MKITDPQPFIDGVDIELWSRLKSSAAAVTKDDSKNDSKNSPVYVEPSGSLPEENAPASASFLPEEAPPTSTSPNDLNIIKGKVQRLGDFIDTDAVSLNHITYLKRGKKKFGG